MKGSCLCGGILVEAPDTVLGVNYCHCRTCRKASGTAFATSVAVPGDGFRLARGQELLRSFESSPGKRRYFCGRCGSPVYSAHAQYPDRVYLRAGILDTDREIAVDVHIHVASKAPWYEILDHLPRRQAEEDLWF